MKSIKKVFWVLMSYVIILGSFPSSVVRLTSAAANDVSVATDNAVSPIRTKVNTALCFSGWA